MMYKVGDTVFCHNIEDDGSGLLESIVYVVRHVSSDGKFLGLDIIPDILYDSNRFVIYNFIGVD